MAQFHSTARVHHLNITARHTEIFLRHTHIQPLQPGCKPSTDTVTHFPLILSLSVHKATLSAYSPQATHNRHNPDIAATPHVL